MKTEADVEGKRTLSAGVWYMLGAGLEQALAVLVLLPLYTGYLGLREYGILALLNAGVGMLTAVLAGPITSALARFYYHPEYAGRRAELLFALLAVLVVKLAVAAAALWFAAPWLAGLLDAEDPGQTAAVVRLFVGVLAGTAIFQFLLMLTRWAQQAVYCTTASVLRAVVGAALAYWLLGRMDGKLLAIAWARAGSVLLGVAMLLPALRGKLRLRLDRKLLAGPLKYGYPMLLNSQAVIVMDSADRYLLKGLGRVGSVGLYDLGYQIGRALQLLAVVPVKMAVMPALLKKEADPDRQRELTRTLATVYYALMTGPAIALSLLAEPIIRLLARNPAYYPAWQVVPFIALTMVHLGLVNFLSLGVVLSNRSGLLAGLVGFCALLNVGLNVAVIPAFDRLGAAAVTVVSYLLWNALLAVASRKLFAQRIDWPRIAFFALAGWGLFTTALLLPVPPGGWWWAVRAAAIAVYGLLLWPTGVYRQLTKLIRGETAPESSSL